MFLGVSASKFDALAGRSRVRIPLSHVLFESKVKSPGHHKKLSPGAREKSIACEKTQNFKTLTRHRSESSWRPCIKGTRGNGDAKGFNMVTTPSNEECGVKIQIVAPSIVDQL